MCADCEKLIEMKNATKRSVYGIEYSIWCGGLLIVLNAVQVVLDFLR